MSQLSPQIAVLTSAYPTLHRLLDDSDLLHDALHDLGAYPNVASDAVCRRARLIGLAGEALVDSLLLRHGLHPSPLPDGASADRLIPLGQRTVRIQIKTRTHPGPRGYAFRMRKGYRGNPLGTRAYEVGDFDIAALVALPANVVFFTCAPGINLTVPLNAIPELAARPLASLDLALQALIEREAMQTGGEPSL
ncbi:hypothetical protein [Yoonia sp. 67-2]|uniref:hypothetical protein n=2 Tax=unclassified Yoonia TaxID=2629118 RepID=UPI002B404FBC|nr:hypothetical protein [Yoonia sp. 67-2]